MSEEIRHRAVGDPLRWELGEWLIRSWVAADRSGAEQLIGNVLREYGLGWEPEGADRDVVEVEDFYQKPGGEFWVVCRRDTGQLVGTAAFLPHGQGQVEIRKMYLVKEARNKGLGGILLGALEARAKHLGFEYAMVETASVLELACHLYTRRGYEPISDVETKRCDMAFRKFLARPEDSERHGSRLCDAAGNFVVQLTNASSLEPATSQP